MHGREHAAIIRPRRRGLVLHTLYYSNEVGLGQESSADLTLISERELELAKMLVSTMSAPFDPAKLKDSFQERVLQLIESRTPAAVPTAHAEEPKLAPVFNITEALTKSLNAVRKPVLSEGTGRTPWKKGKRWAK